MLNQLSSLQRLELVRFLGLLPSPALRLQDLTGLKKLNLLQLCDMGVQDGELPGALAGLEYLHLTENELTHLPMQLSKLTVMRK